MKKLALAASFIVLTATAFAATKSPEEMWKADLAQTNKDYSVTPHAILKIQDAAYLGEGNSATLIGTKGKPASYKWKPGTSGGSLIATYKGGKLILTKDGKALANPLVDVPVDKDVDVQAYPTQVQAGVMGVRIFIYNQQAAAARAFKGVDYMPYDPSYRVTAAFKPDPKLPARTFRTSRGTDKQFYHAGDATFKLQGKTFTLPMFTGSNKAKEVNDLSAFFTDDLTGKETYGAGRYVEASDFGAFPPKTVVLDFNYAYNPNCARSAFFTCPFALDNLKLAVRAGERDPHAKH